MGLNFDFTVKSESNKITGKECIVCGKTEYKYNNSYGSNFCSWACYEKNKQFTTKPNCSCVVCGKEFYLKPSRLKRVATGVVCSAKCKNELSRINMIGSNNHQFGIKGDKNASFKGIEILDQFGYIRIYIPDHPKSDKDGRYYKHVYVVEQSTEFDDKYFDIINGWRVLKPNYIVHHKDENKTNNEANNLQPLTRSEHTTIHNKNNTIIRDENTGKIIGVVKSRELLESLEEDNQQPSFSSNTIEGSTTNSRILTSKVEDSNANTSAGQSNKIDDIV